MLSTHLIGDIAASCDEVVVMHRGMVRFVGSVEQLAERDCRELPGNTSLERAYMHLLPAEEQQL